MRSEGFTLVELLVVIAIMVVLLALLAPAMDAALEAAARANCATQMHGMILASVQYASDNKAALPSGVRNGAFGNATETEHVVWVPSLLIRVAKEYGGHDVKGRGETNPLLTCPNFAAEFGFHDSTTDNYVIGYSWLAGLTAVSEYNQQRNDWATFNQGKANRWETPRRTTDSAAAMIADHNAWAAGAGGWMFVAHTAGGPLGGPDAGAPGDGLLTPAKPPNPDINYFNWGMGGPTAHPELAGSAGGNVGRSDGSVAWKRIGDMYVYESSVPWTGYPAMW